MRIRDLFIYPLKSAAGMRVADATVDALGFAGDRRWMVVDADNLFLSQRRIPAMALIQATRLGDDDLYLSAPGVRSLHAVRPDETALEQDVTVWQDTVRARDGGDEAAAWISALLRHRARLVYCPPTRARVVDTQYASGTERVAFADAFPLLVLGYSSVEEINGRLAAQGVPPIGVERFRPNIVVEDAEPFAEDAWTQIRVGGSDGGLCIDIVKPCARCSIISVDPRTGVQGVEPMRTLATYRRRHDNVYVAQNALPRGEGRLTTGAVVTCTVKAD
jgi:uncharacterized protein YcbX